MLSPGFCHPALTYCCSLLTAPPHGPAGQLLHFPGATYGGCFQRHLPLKHTLIAFHVVLRIGSECSSFVLSTLKSKVVSPEAQGWWQRCLLPPWALLLTDLSVQSGYKMWFPFQALTLLTLGKVCWPHAGCRQTDASVGLSSPLHPLQDSKKSTPQFTHPKDQEGDKETTS